jgi:hypothetical protein
VRWVCCAGRNKGKVNETKPPPSVSRRQNLNRAKAQKEKERKTQMKTKLMTMCLVMAVLAIGSTAQANLGQIYTTANSIGTITPYRTLADAQAGTNPVSSPVDAGSHVFSLYLDTTDDAPEGFEVYVSTYSSMSLGEFQFFYSDAEVYSLICFVHPSISGFKLLPRTC